MIGTTLRQNQTLIMKILEIRFLPNSGFLCIAWLLMIISAFHTRTPVRRRFLSKEPFLRKYPCELKSWSRTFHQQQSQYIITNDESRYNPALHELKSLNSYLKFAVTNDRTAIARSDSMWTHFRNGIQLDSLVLEDQYLGRHKLSNKQTAKLWYDNIEARLSPRVDVARTQSYLADELEVAIGAVQQAAYVIRSLQHILLNPTSDHFVNRILQTTLHSLSLSKEDNTPVTVADFAIQALIIDTLSTAFPSDLFIAEENSAVVRSDPTIRQAVLVVLHAATGAEWSAEQLYDVLDRGSGAAANTAASNTRATITDSTLNPQRVWVLDPIDGTKGFMRGEHCCTGLGLLINGVTQMSVLGCPNLNLLRLLQGSSYDDKDIAYIDPPIVNSSATNTNTDAAMPAVFHPHSGSIYYAVSKQGAFARSLSMPRGAAYEVTTSTVAESSRARLCESAEALFGDREISAHTAEKLGVKKDFLRIDGELYSYYCTA